APLAAALISAVAVAVLTLCTTLFLRSYRSAVVEAARTNSAQAVSQVVGTVGNYVSTMDSAVSIVMERLDDDTASRDAFLSAFLTARPEVAAITAYDADGQLLECWAQEGRKPKDAILRNLSFDLATARRLGHGYISTPHVESIFEGYYPWVVSVIRIVPEGDTARCWLSVDLSFKELAATISNVGIGQHGYCYLMDERGNMVYHPQQQLLYAGLKKEEAGRLACLGEGTYVEDTVIY
uniref:cache domain-containing protein n=1 Tax=Gemmiger sp. TaxID=2049027 RepID=UPI003FEECF39